MSRKPVLTQEAMDHILDEVSDGRTLNSICRKEKQSDIDAGVPCRKTVTNALLIRPPKDHDPKYEADAERYAEFRELFFNVARPLQFMAWEDHIIEIADDSSQDWRDVVGKDGEIHRVMDKEVVQRSRVRIDTRKWLMAKALPKKYGEKIQQEVTGDNGAPLIQPVVNISVADKSEVAPEADNGTDDEGE